MALHRSSIAVIALVAVVLGFSLAILAGADEMEAAVPEQSVRDGALLPAISRGQGDNCVADTEFMRRNHMSLLKHQRDETMLQGIRSEPYSIKECVSCHAVAGPDAMPLTAASPDHFCRSCHDYAAVKIDCFQCHASRPEIVADESE